MYIIAICLQSEGNQKNADMRGKHPRELSPGLKNKVAAAEACISATSHHLLTQAVPERYCGSLHLIETRRESYLDHLRAIVITVTAS